MALIFKTENEFLKMKYLYNQTIRYHMKFILFVISVSGQVNGSKSEKESETGVITLGD